MAVAPAEVVQAVADLLSPVEGRTPREINAWLPEISRASVRNALYFLMEEGRVMFEGEMGKRRYRLVTI